MRALLDLRINRDLAQDAGLSEPDYDVLSNVSEAPDRTMRMNELASRMLWTPSRVSHQVRRMEQRRLGVAVRLVPPRRPAVQRRYALRLVVV